MKVLCQKALHCIRVLASFIPGGVSLASFVLKWMAQRHDRRARNILHAQGMKTHRVIYETLTQSDVSYFADHGTLLGLIRDNGVIAHDTDMDFSIPPDESLARVYAALSKKGFRLLHGFMLDDTLEEMTLCYQGLSIDFFRCHRIGNDLGHYVFINDYAPKTGTLLRTWAHERKRPPLAGLETREFGRSCQVKVSIPRNAVEYLTASYGNWQVPDSKTDFCSDKIPTQYRDIHEGCKFLNANEVKEVLERASLYEN